MKENDWTNYIKEILQDANLGNNIFFSTLTKMPYAQEIISYNLDFKINKESSTSFETDLLVYEKKDSIIKPRIIIESKINTITTHDAITYSNKAQSHKNVTPYIRYGVMLGNRRHYPLPGRLFRHGTNFDFMISFKAFELSDSEKHDFIELIKKELSYSRKIEEMIYESRHKSRKHYYILHNELKLTEIKIDS
ncbi:MAG: hypothetical protein ACPKMZ_12435 [Pleomorphochaeta sp.]